MSNREPELLIGDILDSAHKIIDYIGDISFEEFCADSKTFDAVIRNFEIIGEAAGRLPEDFKQSHTQIDWHRIRGFRNRIVHDYMGIDYKIVWEIKNHFLPNLILEISKIRF